MATQVCPWWMGFLLASPVRRLLQAPEGVVGPYIEPGMTVLEPGPGMGFFTLPMAEMTGPNGRIIAVDVQPKMLDGLRRRALKAELLDRIETRIAQPDRMGLDDLKGQVDFVLAFAMVHELPSVDAFFREIAVVLKPDATVLFAEPAGHVKPKDFQRELNAAKTAGLEVESRPEIPRSLAAVLRKA